MIPEPYKHQGVTTEFLLDRPQVFVTSEPGTGKSRSVLDAFYEVWRKDNKQRAVVYAPLSILRSSWADDADKFTPNLPWAVAHDKTRESAFKSDAAIIFTNHDTVKYLDRHVDLVTGKRPVTWSIIDESPAFKHRGSQRSKAAARLTLGNARRTMMSGSPSANDITDIWHQAYLLDRGQRLGSSFYRFRSQVCQPEPTGPGGQYTNWVPMEHAEEMVFDALRDITIGFTLDECFDMPQSVVRDIYVDLPKKVMDTYQALEADAAVLMESGEYISAVHAGAKVQKMLQVLSGAVYGSDGQMVRVYDDRYALVAELAAQRAHTLIAFQWHHEKEAIGHHLAKHGLSYEVIDGDTNLNARTETVRKLQNGELRVVLAHPQTAAHGLTMTRAKTLIWPTPFSNAEFYNQFNRRIRRAGQTERTEIIRLCARNTREDRVFNMLHKRMDKSTHLLALFAGNKEMEAA